MTSQCKSMVNTQNGHIIFSANLWNTLASANFSATVIMKICLLLSSALRLGSSQGCESHNKFFCLCRIWKHTSRTATCVSVTTTSLAARFSVPRRRYRTTAKSAATRVLRITYRHHQREWGSYKPPSYRRTKRLDSYAPCSASSARGSTGWRSPWNWKSVSFKFWFQVLPFLKDCSFL